jgi:hypothetical protein
VEPHQYYDNLNKGEVNDLPRLIVMIEAAIYCETRQRRFITYSPLRTKSNDRSNILRKSDIGSGTFASIIDSLSNPSILRKDRFLTCRRIKVKGKKVTRIYPNIPLIQQEVKARQAENLDDGESNILVYRRKTDAITRPRPIFESSIVVSESLAKQTSKTRTIGDSVSTSERLSMVVMHAKPKKV